MPQHTTWKTEEMDFTAHASLECLKTPSMRTEHRDGTKQTRRILLWNGSSCAQAQGWSVQGTDHQGREGQGQESLTFPSICRSKTLGILTYAQDGGPGRGQP